VNAGSPRAPPNETYGNCGWGTTAEEKLTSAHSKWTLFAWSSVERWSLTDFNGSNASGQDNSNSIRGRNHQGHYYEQAESLIHQRQECCTEAATCSVCLWPVGKAEGYLFRTQDWEPRTRRPPNATLLGFLLRGHFTDHVYVFQHRIKKGYRGKASGTCGNKWYQDLRPIREIRMTRSNGTSIKLPGTDCLISG
jgi:hypothetical protein